MNIRVQTRIWSGRALAGTAVLFGLAGTGTIAILAPWDFLVVGFVVHNGLLAVGFGALAWASIPSQPRNGAVWALAWAAFFGGLFTVGAGAFLLLVPEPGFSMVLEGIGTLKLALFPLHLWLPNAYTYAPSAVTAFIASTATKVAVYLLLRFFFTVFGASFSFDVMQLDKILMPLALVAILTMSLVAIYQDNVKRLLAYSSVAQIGYMVLGISFASVLGVTAGILHLFNHALMKGALFMAMGC